MTERIINRSSLQEYLSKIILSEKIKIKEINNIITLEQIHEDSVECPLLGIAAGSKLTVEKFLAMSHGDKEFET
jgi:hypothetical protein